MYTLGYDIGTRFIKTCIVKDKKIISTSCLDIGNDLAQSIKNAKKNALSSSDLRNYNIKKTNITGFGAELIKKKGNVVNNALALASSVHLLDKNIRTIVDAGGLFISVININENGKVIGMTEIEKCAAGSGRFLETISGSLELPFCDISESAYKSKVPYEISTGCAVFAESEVISHVNRGGKREDIIAGIIKSIVSKVITSIKRSSAEDKIALVGGVSKIEAFRTMLQDELNREIVLLPVDLQIVGAYGAAILAERELKGA